LEKRGAQQGEQEVSWRSALGNCSGLAPAGQTLRAVRGLFAAGTGEAALAHFPWGPVSIAHVLIGQATGRKLLNFGGTYTHISNASAARSNRGIDSGIFQVAWSFGR